MDILLINPSSSATAYQKLFDAGYSAIETPTWSLLLGQGLRNKGFKVGLLDCDAENLNDEEAISRIETLSPRLCCFVLYGQNPNAGTTSMIGGIRLASRIKGVSNISAKICFIGSHTSALPEEVLNYEFVDFIVYNDALYGLSGLLRSNFVKDLDEISGLGFKTNNIIHINSKAINVENKAMDEEFPGYAWDLLPKKNKPLDLYRAHYWHTNFLDDGRTPFAAIYTSLGCQFSCNFCMINIVNRDNNNLNGVASDYKGMRFWSPEFILGEFQKLSDMGVKTVRISDEMFFLNKKYYVPILEGLIRKGLKFNLWAYARVDSVRNDQLALFKEAGVNWLCLGIEAGNQTVRIEIDKGRFKQVDIRDVVAKIKESNINILGNYMFGFPEENFETMQETLDLAIDLNCEHANFYAATALPGSPLYKYAKEMNWDLPKKYEEYAFLSYDCKPLPTKYLKAEDVLSFRDHAWHTYFTGERYLSMIEAKFGIESRKNIEKLSNVKLKRKILGD